MSENYVVLLKRKENLVARNTSHETGRATGEIPEYSFVYPLLKNVMSGRV
jgi:hypothetical protein